DDGDVDRRVPQGHLERVGVLHGRDDLAPVGGQEPDEPVPQEGEVFGEDHAHGTSRVIRVGPPRGLSTTMVPSNADSRTPTPRRPDPRAGSAPPTPSSPTSTRSEAAPASSRTHTRAADACLT